LRICRLFRAFLALVTVDSLHQEWLELKEFKVYHSIHQDIKPNDYRRRQHFEWCANVSWNMGPNARRCSFNSCRKILARYSGDLFGPVGESAMTVSELSLLVLRAKEPEKLVSFYGNLGLLFVREQHDFGPAHHSCQVGGLILEIYPLDDVS
jgi:hypothetical protein